MAATAAHAAANRKAANIVALDVSDQLVITDVFVIASASNERQVGAIVDNVEEKLRNSGHKPVRREGAKEGRWVLLDYVDLVVHVQHDEERAFYGLERLWKDCPTLELPGLKQPSPGQESPGQASAGQAAQGQARATEPGPAQRGAPEDGVDAASSVASGRDGRGPRL